MKKLINQLQTVQSAFEAKILDREEYYDNRSEKWQESEKGEEYQELTDRLREMYDEITDYIAELED